MPDMEKVIQHLQILRTWAAVNPDFGMGLDVKECKKAVEWLDDALALLKEQEPVESTIGRAVEHDGHDSWWYQCGKCKGPIDWQDRYCRHCGKPVKWE